MVAGMVYVHILLCTSMAIFVLRDVATPLWLALSSWSAQPKIPTANNFLAVLAATGLWGDRSGDREAARGRHLAELARLLESLKGGDDRQAAAAAPKAFKEASALAALPGAGLDREARALLFGAVEAALEALDPRDGRARAAAEGLLAELRLCSALPAWQLDRLCDTLEVQLELDSVMGSAVQASYEQLPSVRAERAGDHRLADLLDAEYDAMHAKEQVLGTAC